uniref:TMEM127 domain-containing protein n=1 Tax=Heligmosomoides polygyrus TaxID=6339 RepID=A0A183GML2_HELPZ
LLSSEWILIEEPSLNSTENENSELFFDVSRSDHCTNIGCRDFWRPARFGGFLDNKGKTHIAFHSNERVLLDCVTPMVANLFYVLIALCFVIALTSSLSFIMNLLPPPSGFLQWLKRNTIFEMCNMLLTLCVCVIALIAQCEIARVRPDCDVSLGGGVFMVCLAGMVSLRSWRDSARRPDDVLPIVDFERYAM